MVTFLAFSKFLDPARYQIIPADHETRAHIGYANVRWAKKPSAACAARVKILYILSYEVFGGYILCFAFHGGVRQFA